MFKKIVMPFVVVALFGCASNDSYDRLAAEKEKQEIIELKNDQLRDNVDSLPEWAINPPKSDQEGMYAVGMGASDSFATALKMATLEAEFGLAKMYSL